MQDKDALSWRRASWWVLGPFLATAAFYLWAEHRAHLFGALPYLLIGACLIMHFFHHRGHGDHARDEQHARTPTPLEPTHRHGGAP